MPNDEPQPGPSGTSSGNEKANEKRWSRTITWMERKKDKHQNRLQQHNRCSSYDVTLRYKLVPRSQGTQQSHTVRRVVAAPRPQSRGRSRERRETRYVVHEPELKNKSHHHLDAVDFYYRSTHYGQCNHNHDGLNRLRHKVARTERIREAKVRQHKTNRCRNCLELVSNCICVLSIDRPTTSDWMTIFQDTPERPRKFFKPRNDWLTNLEEVSRVKPEVLAERKFNRSREICCFPFNTFRIFSKRDIECVDFYRKNP